MSKGSKGLRSPFESRRAPLGAHFARGISTLLRHLIEQAKERVHPNTHHRTEPGIRWLCDNGQTLSLCRPNMPHVGVVGKNMESSKSIV